MTKLLLKLFVKNNENGTDPAVRAKVGKLSGMVGIVANAILCAGKLFTTMSCRFAHFALICAILRKTKGGLPMYSDRIAEQAANLCHNIAWLRRRNGLSQKEMALTLGLGVRSLQRIEKGQIPGCLSVLHVHLLAELFGVSVKRLFAERLDEESVS